MLRYLFIPSPIMILNYVLILIMIFERQGRFFTTNFEIM